MKRTLLLTATLVAAALVVVTPSSLARNSTTAPGYNFRIDVYITPSDVTITRSFGRRGWLAHFRVHNQTKKSHVFEIGGLKSKPVLPGKTRTVGAYLTSRGQFAYKIDNQTRGFFTVT
jgi:hypothetical protein